LGIKEYEEYGQAMLTTAVFAIIITAPLGAIMINTLGTKWLSYDGEPEEKPADDPEKPIVDNNIQSHKESEPAEQETDR